MVEFQLDASGQKRLEDYFAKIGKVLGSEERQASYALYANGLLGSTERKNMEAIAAHVCPDPENVDAVHQQIQQFVTDSQWEDAEVRRVATQHALPELLEREVITHSIIDDTGFLKQGNHSVGVQ